MAKSQSSAVRTAKQAAEKTVRLPQFERNAQVRSESFDAEANTIEIVWTTGASVRRYDYWDGIEYDEVLQVDSSSVRLDRLNAGAPFLDTHCSYGLDNVIGSVVPGTAEVKDGRGIATILLSKASGVADTVQKIREGVIRNISVGYWIHKVVKTEGDEGTVARWDVVDWEPLEISAVPIPADPGSQVRSETQTDDGKGRALRSCVVVDRSPSSARAPKSQAHKDASMATRTAPKKNPAKRATPAEAEAEKKRLAALRAAKRDDDKKDDEDDADSDDERDEDADEENAADDTDSKKDDGESDDERDGDMDDDEEDDADDEDGKRAAPAAGKRAMTAADVRKAAEAAVRADRIRGAKIREIASQFGLPKLGERHASGETSVRAFKDLVLERLAKRQAERGNATFAAVDTPEVGGRAAGGAPIPARDYESGAAEARALLGKK